MDEVNQCNVDFKEYNVAEGLTRRCTQELIDFYDCAYPANLPQDIEMGDKMWANNLKNAKKAQATKAIQDQS